jgi:hypothetical protein
LPIRVGPISGELMTSYLRRLAAANHVNRALLIRHLATDSHHYIGPIDIHDLALNQPALA